MRFEKMRSEMWLMVFALVFVSAASGIARGEDLERDLLGGGALEAPPPVPALDPISTTDLSLPGEASTDAALNGMPSQKSVADPVAKVKEKSKAKKALAEPDINSEGNAANKPLAQSAPTAEKTPAIAATAAAVGTETMAVAASGAQTTETKPVNASTIPAAVAPPSPVPTNFVEFSYAPADIPERSFKITVPGDWDVKADNIGFNVYMEPKVKLKATTENPTVADPKITVEVLRRAMFIDQKGLEDYEAEIKKQFADKPALGTDLNVYQKLLFPVSDTRKAFVFDLTYLWNGHEIFSTVVIMANQKYMYRATLTDYKVNYSLNRDRLYPVMASLNFVGNSLPRPAWYEAYLPWAYSGGGAVVVLFFFQWMYVRRARRNVGGDEDDDLENLVELDSNAKYSKTKYNNHSQYEGDSQDDFSNDAGDLSRPQTQAPLTGAGWEPSRASSSHAQSVQPGKSAQPATSAQPGKPPHGAGNRPPPPPRAPQSTSDLLVSGQGLSKVPTRPPKSTPAQSAAASQAMDFPRSNFGGADESRALDSEFADADGEDFGFAEEQDGGFPDEPQASAPPPPGKRKKSVPTD